ncbi:MAG: S9 family peptidase [Henriciella sp.]|nr:S9 family peptidase [Henriciella sp.]
MSLNRAIGAILVCGLLSTPALADDHGADESRKFTAERVFDIEYASDPQISPDGETIVYVRRSMDKLTDRDRGDIWTIDVKSGAHRPLITGGASAGAPRWSPDGTKLIYTTATDGKPDLRLYYFDSDRSVSLGQFSAGPGNAAWSPDGSTIAFTMFTPGQTPSFAKPPAAPEGATWSDPVRVFDDLQFRFDGAGYLKEGATHVYTLPADGGTPRQITSGEADFGSPTWLGNDTLLVVGNEAEDRDLDPIESEIYAVNLSDLSRSALTTRDGPDLAPSVSPDGSQIAYLGYDDLVKSYQQADLYVMNADGSDVVELAADFDRGFSTVTWHPNGRSLIAQIENAGVIDVISVSMDGEIDTIVTNVGGTSIGRPYAAGSFTVSDTRRPVIAYTAGSPDRPAEIAVTGSRINDRVLTDLNSDVLDHLDMATIEEIKVPSRHDGLEIEAWVALPPGFEADGSAPMLMEIHGGPFAMYGPYFASEIQRFAAEGYVTVYVNPRGSTGYGSDFAMAIDLAYPGYDYEDLMSVTDALIERNYVSADRLFVTGGSGGGILTAWIVGKTDRFAAAATVKPVINWMTMALSADIAQFVRRHWIRSDPWENPEAFLDRSPIMLIEDVVTPTLVMVGEEDWRTPTWEAEQFYTALKLKGVDTALIRVPGSPHYIAGRPSRLIAKTDNIMGWFAKYDPAKQESED